jgi:hypothetical protein
MVTVTFFYCLFAFLPFCGSPRIGYYLNRGCLLQKDSDAVFRISLLRAEASGRRPAPSIGNLDQSRFAKIRIGYG